jgi:hypothetical protein
MLHTTRTASGVSAEAIQEAFSFSKLVVVVGVLREKDAEEILRQLKESLGGLAEEFCFTQSNSPRAVPAAELAELAVDLGFGEENVHIAEKLDDALEWAVERAEANDDLARRRAGDGLHHAGGGCPHPAWQGRRLMARLTKAQREWRPGMPKKRRSTKVMFASTVLLLEAFVVFFATLAVFGLRRAEISPALILSVGIGLSVVLILACAVLSRPWGVALGWVLQLVLILSGFAEPLMFLVGALFALAWWYGIRAGIRIDRESAQRDREQAEWDAAHPEAAGNEGTGQTP